MKNLIPALGVAILPFLSQVSVSNQGIHFSSGDVGTIEGAFNNWIGSIFDMLVSFGPVIIGVVILFIVLRWLGNRMG